MAKDKTMYVCDNCGQESAKWIGKCPACGQWNTFKEIKTSPQPLSKGRGTLGNSRGISDRGRDAAKVLRLKDISSHDDPRIDMHDQELNRVLGGGLVPGSIVLLGGEPGIGKSTLSLQTMLQLADKKVLYVTSEQFMQQYAEAGRAGTTNDFIHFYELIDVLIVDDIQFWAGKAQKTQEAFFHIFNHLHQRNCQIIITSDKAPGELQGLEPRLLSRLKWGLNADLQAPDVETRKAILRQKLQNDGIEMSDEVIEYIAYNINTNVRELEGALISLIAQSSLNRKQITLELTKQMIDKYVQSSTREITIDYIQKVVCDSLDLPVESIQMTSRKREIVQARQLSMYFAKKITKSSLAVIGMQCGNKDHATVLHACKTIENLRQTDRYIRGLVDELEKKFKEA